MAQYADVNRLSEVGFLVIDSLIDRGRIEMVRGNIDALGLKPVPTGEGSNRVEFTFVSSVGQRSPAVLKLAQMPEVVSAVSHFLGPNIDLVRSESVVKHAHGTKSLPWHQDEAYLKDIPSPSLNVLIVLDDSSIESGCLAVLPGSQKRGLIEHRLGPDGLECHSLTDPDQGVPLQLKAGGAVIPFTSCAPRWDKCFFEARHRLGTPIREGSFGRKGSWPHVGRASYYDSLSPKFNSSLMLTQMQARPMDHISVESLFGGWPFLDDGFVPSRLLAAVVCMRRHVDQKRIPSAAPSDLSRYLAPAVARQLRPENDTSTPILSRVPDAQEQQRIIQAQSDVSAFVPSWEQLLRLPIEYQILLDPSFISCSAYHYPQHVFLNASVLTSRAELCEQLIHELCHNWTYLIEELAPLEADAPSSVFTLPSGTKGKSDAEVLGAGYVAAILIKWYSLQPDARLETNRLPYLVAYLRGCLQLIPQLKNLSRIGTELAERLTRDEPVERQAEGGRVPNVQRQDVLVRI